MQKNPINTYFPLPIIFSATRLKNTDYMPIVRKNSKKGILFLKNYNLYGIRNALNGMLQPLEVRQDVGVLWENFLVSERLKFLSYSGSYANSYFWRTTQQQVVDYIEEIEGKTYGFEFKWSSKRKHRFPKTFTKAYNSENSFITRENFRKFIASPLK